MIAAEVEGIWKTDEWCEVWFDRACRQQVDDALRPLIDEWRLRATKVEIQHLENPHLSVRSLVAAEGNLNLALTFEQNERVVKTVSEPQSALVLETTRATGRRFEASAHSIVPAIDVAQEGAEGGIDAAKAESLTIDAQPTAPSVLPGNVDRKGDVALLLGHEGKLKDSVSYDHARLYLGVSRRQVERLVSGKKCLTTVGRGHNKQITVSSLLVYLPAKITT